MTIEYKFKECHGDLIGAFSLVTDNAWHNVHSLTDYGRQAEVMRKKKAPGAIKRSRCFPEGKEAKVWTYGPSDNFSALLYALHETLSAIVTNKFNLPQV